MSSLFDSKVYNKRRKADFLSPSIIQFMKMMAYNKQTHDYCGQKLEQTNENPEISLSVCHRNNVSSGMWYTLKWIDEDGKEHRVEAQDLDLCGWRAITVHEEVKEWLLKHKFGDTKDLRGMIFPNAQKCDKCFKSKYINERGDEWCSNIYCPY